VLSHWLRVAGRGPISQCSQNIHHLHNSPSSVPMESRYNPIQGAYYFLELHPLEKKKYVQGSDFIKQFQLLGDTILVFTFSSKPSSFAGY
jgi:hypothetical protein